MATSLEVKGGEIIVPFSISDVMDCVEDYMGSEVRQYLEDYLMDNTTDTQEMEEEMELTERNAQEIVQRYRDVLSAVEEIVDLTEIRYMGKRVDRQGILKQFDSIRKMIRKEL